jgi:histidine triad (HIT) family protein
MLRCVRSVCRSEGYAAKSDTAVLGETTLPDALFMGPILAYNHHMNDCIFCKIIAGEIPSEKIYENEHAYAFLDIKPINPGHILLIPKHHAKNLYEMPDDDLAHLAPLLKKLARAAKDAMNAEGINIVMNNEIVAGQLVSHAHFHIIPRHQGDGHEHWKGTPYKENEIKAIGEKIKNNL